MLMLLRLLGDNIRSTKSTLSEHPISSSSVINENENNHDLQLQIGVSGPPSEATHDDSNDPDYNPLSDNGSEDDEVYNILADAVSSDSNFRRQEEEFGIASPIINPEIPNCQQDSPLPLPFHEFTLKVDNFDGHGHAALSLLQEKRHLSWASDHMGFNDTIQLNFTHYWDYIALNGVPWQPLNLRGGQLRTIKFALKKWRQSYQNTRYFTTPVHNAIPYTVRLGSDTRLQLYLICHYVENDRSGSSDRNDIQHLSEAHFGDLFSLIIHVFENTPELCRYGINGSTRYCDFNLDITFSDWSLFQLRLLEEWHEFFQSQGLMSFWGKITPTMHLIDFGGNIRLDATSHGTADLRQLQESLSLVFDANNLHSFSFAIATEINAIFKLPNGSTHSIALLSHTPSVRNQFPASQQNKLDVYPIAFSPDVCCWQSKVVPHFYRSFVDSLMDSLGETESGPIISCDSVQAYQAIDKQVRPNPTQWWFKDSPYPAGLNVESSQLPTSKRALWERLASNARNHVPIDGFLNAIAIAKQNGQCNLRFEPVFTVKWHLLDEERQTVSFLISHIINPIMDVWHRNGREWVKSVLRPFPYWVRSL
jgi:hypothetical protein